MPEALPRLVEVLHQGRWWPGVLEAVRRDDDGWRGFVRFSVGPSATHVLWFGEADLRRHNTISSGGPGAS